MLQYLEAENVQVNSVTIKPETQEDKESETANTEGLDQDKGGINNA